MTPGNTNSSANPNQNAPATATASSTSTSVSASSSSTSRPLYPRPLSSNHPAKPSLPTTSWRELPRLQLAPPEHQKQPHAQVKQLLLQQHHQEQQQQQQQNVLVPNAVPGGSPESASSSRSASPTSEEPNKAGDKRKSASVNPNTKKRRTEQPSQQQFYQVRQDYSFGTQYPHLYYAPTASTSTSSLNYQSPAATASHSPAQASRQTPATSATNNYSTFNEFQWRLLHLCSEFYEAATELIRSTPPPVLSQAFQLINNGTGTDPISVLNDARKTCDMLIANPQLLAVPPPFPSPIPVPTLTSLLHLNARSVSGPPPLIPVTHHSPSLPSTTATPPYSSTSALPAAVGTPTDPRPQDEAPKSTSGAANFTSIAQSGQVQGTWKEHEIAKLKELAEKYRIRKKDGKAPATVPEEAEEVEEAEEEEEEEQEKSPTVQTDGANNAPTDTAAESTPEDADTGNATAPSAKKSAKDFDEIDWDQVVAEFGDERSRHQILIKATFLGLKPSSSLPGVKKKRKKRKTPAQPFAQLLTSVALPSPTTTAATSNASQGAATSSAQVLTLTPAATLASGASVTAFYNTSLRNKPGAGTSPQYTPSPAPAPAVGGTTSSSKSTAQLPSARSTDKTTSTADKAQPTTRATTVAPPTTTATTPSAVASPATVGTSSVPAYGVPPPPPWSYPPPSATMGQPIAGQGATPYYPYAGMYYPQGYPMQSYPIPGASPIPGVGVTSVPGGATAPPPPLFVQTHPHYNPPHGRRNAPVGQTFYAYVPRTEDNPGPKKTTKKSAANANTTASASAGAGSATSTFVVPNVGNVSQKTSRSDQTTTDRPASVTPAATPKSTAAEPQLPT